MKRLLVDIVSRLEVLHRQHCEALTELDNILALLRPAMELAPSALVLTHQERREVVTKLVKELLHHDDAHIVATVCQLVGVGSSEVCRAIEELRSGTKGQETRGGINS